MPDSGSVPTLSASNSRRSFACFVSPSPLAPIPSVNMVQLINDSLIKYKDTDNKWAVLVGPEGGFSDIEKQFIIKHKNFLPVSLGNTLLRSDTAIIVSLFSIQQLLF